jgi:heat shock protein HslJ
MKTIKLLALFTLLLLTTWGFNTNVSAGIKPNQPDLFGTQWKLTKIEGNEIDVAKAFIRFDEAKNSIGGNGGCNAFGGSMEKNENQIKFSKIISTKMYCEGVQDVEDKFMKDLERVTKYEISHGKLRLISDDKILLEFEPKK